MKRIPVVIVLVLVLLGVFASPALALNPPDSLSFQSVKAFRNLAEDGDMLIVFHFRIEYDSYPDTPASDSFIFRLYSDNETLLAQSQPYVYSAFVTNGYGDGISSFYFTAEDAPSWGVAHQINILGVPTYYDPIQTLTYEMTAADYSSTEDQADSRSDLYNEIILISDKFKSIYPDISLKAITDTGVVLSSYGESYFRAVILGLQSLCPQLFFIQVYTPEKMEVASYNMTLEETYTERLAGTDLMRGAERIGDFFGGLSGAFVFGIMAFLGSVALCIVTLRQGWGIEPGLIGSSGIVILGAIIVGNMFFTLTMIGGLIAGMAIMFIFAYKRA